jgi:hypothetical protein
MAIVHAGDLIPSLRGYFSICIMEYAAPSNDDHAQMVLAHEDEHWLSDGYRGAYEAPVA